MTLHVVHYAGADPGGLWIDKSVAKALNARDAEDMRHGFTLQAHNARGFHWVDPTGAPERELAAEYARKAAEVEDAGSGRFAAELRVLARSYEHEAARVVNEHQSEAEEEGGRDSDSGAESQ